MQSIVLPSQKLTSFPNYLYTIAFIINFEKVVQTRILALVNFLNCHLLPDVSGWEQGGTGRKSLLPKDLYR